MRVTTTIDDQLAKEAQAKAQSLNESMSAFIAEAVKLRLEQLGEAAAHAELEALVGEGFAEPTYKEVLREVRDA